MLKVNVFFDEESIRKLIYDSLATELPKIEGEICNYDIKQIIFDMTKKIITYDIEWADSEKFGKNKMLYRYKFFNVSFKVA